MLVLVDLIVWSITIVSLVLEIVFVIGFLLGKLKPFFFPSQLQYVCGVVKKVKRKTKKIMELGWEKRCERERNSTGFYVMSGLVGPILFYIITIMPLNTVTLKPKTIMMCFLNAMFKHLKLRIVTQTLKKIHFYQTQIFFWGP